MPDVPGRDRRSAPPASFLLTLREAFGAERASLLRLDRERGTWTVEREELGPEGGDGTDEELEARGHPLTWCVREELTVQVPAGDLTGDRGREGWALVGPVPGSLRALVLVFHGAPPSGARRAMRPALDHLAALQDALDPEEPSARREEGGGRTI